MRLIQVRFKNCRKERFGVPYVYVSFIKSLILAGSLSLTIPAFHLRFNELWLLSSKRKNSQLHRWEASRVYLDQHCKNFGIHAFEENESLNKRSDKVVFSNLKLA